MPSIFEVPRKKYAAFNDTAFVTGTSPATHNVDSVIGGNGFTGFIDNYGSGDVKYSISIDGTNYGSDVYLPAGACDQLRALSIHSIKVTWVENTTYSIRIK